MQSEQPPSKVEAIYALRDAVEAKVRAEYELDQAASPAKRDALLDAQLEVEAKTQDAIEICHECGDSSADGHAHLAGRRVHGRTQNVVHVDFRPGA
jgi:hypothetical protein